ncbi:MAG: hypothetical protein JXB17_06340, partial [Bacteroidales bacterium]|nr:hypothetical protein [Bacteroidales bacterium]
MIKHVLSILSILFFNFYYLFSADTKFIFEIAEKLQIFQTNFSEENVFIHIDKNKYAPGETLWFKAYINDPAYNTASSKSEKLFIKIIDNKGKIYSSDIFRIEQGKSYGDIAVPGVSEEGTLYLIAYTSWMKNGNQSASITPITISTLIPEILIDIDFSSSNEPYFNDSKVKITLSDKTQKPLSNLKFSYSLTADGESYLNKDISTDENGTANISIPIPEKAYDKQVKLNIETKNKKNREQFSYIIPKPGIPLLVNFYPENGKLISGLKNKVVISVTDKYNHLFDFEGIILNSKNEQIAQINSTIQGKA